MKKLFISLLAVMTSAMAFAIGQWTLQGNAYTIDTLFHAQVGPGTTQTSLSVVGPTKLRVFYTTTDLTNPYVEMRATMANDKLGSGATVASIGKSHHKEGALYFAGVNADFFSGSYPIGTTVSNGEIYYASNNGWYHWAIDEDKVPHLGQMTVGGTVTNAAGTSSHSITGFNRAREANNMIIYTPKYGSTTGTNAYGSEVLITPIDGAIAMGKAVKVKVVSSPATAGSMAIPAGSYVLSGHGTAATFVSSLTEGEEITVNLTLNLGETSIAATQVLGGKPTILSGGQVLNTQNELDHLTALNPRTAVGHDATGTKLVMLVVDGRSQVSVGCVSKVLADIMREVGCSEALNFDGGGSSTLYVDALGVRNVPSEGSERSVPNALFAVATAPTDNEIASIAFVDQTITLPKHGYFTPTIYAYNKYGVLISTNVTDYQLSSPAGLGEVIEGGKTLYANGSGTHVLTATINGVKATAIVTIGASEPKFTREKVLVDSYSDYTVEVTATVDGIEMPLGNEALTWSSEDASIATVDATGKIHGVKNGTTTVRGVVDDSSDEIVVTVEIPEKRYLAIDPSLDPSTWTASGSVSEATFSAIGTDGVAVDYKLSSTRGASMMVSKKLQLWSLPDSLLLDINPAEVKISKIMLTLTSLGDSKTVTYNHTLALTASTVNRVLIPFSRIFDVADVAIFPIELKGITFYLSGVKTATAYRLEMPKMMAVYNAVPAEEVGIEDVIVESMNSALQLSPNPVNAGDVVKINVEDIASYAVYSVNGTLVAQGVGNEISTAGMPQGIYVVKVMSENGLSTARLIIK